ncbi:lipoprotein-releasing system ATP-binding protein LolD [candidate division KSB3 bacterium]|uniref:Lipoprotein-releasing system ATP-binding protein LolD n=1 Tax=candidate division KSB3 bacterium TaxID=2044937 RepID=A0A2G6E7P8_9BACT|nr:MAG: lipoprotein-releasing system ATP-binding protein LolD [candidate division KSB3 bacterium]PIE30473.1 MAG: lipoprotein-releasing system ATP-binding protein LolD [candidate division KSB3 bacterium]
MSSYIRAKGVGKDFQIGAETLHVLKESDLDIERREIISIVGASGAGKSTLLHLLGALDRPSFGTVFYEDTDIFRLSDNALAKFRNQYIGFVFQFHHLLPEFTALENVMMPLLIHRCPKRQAHDQALHALEQVGLSARLAHKPGELSGGEQQRVAIARAIVNRPSILFADEPTGNLDTKTGDSISDLLLTLNQETGIVIVLVTHNEQLARLTGRIIKLSDGVIQRDTAQTGP